MDQRTKTCQQCGKAFCARRYEDQDHWQRRKLCSQACAWASMKGRPARNKGVKEDIAKRFWNLVDDSGGPDACWLWQGTTNSKGQGGFQIDGKKCKAVRVAWELTFGLIPNRDDSYHGTIVRHKCDVPECVNPKHLELGTQFDNIQDRDKRGRRADTHGESHPSNRLINADIIEIRRRVSKGEMQKDVAEAFSISRGLCSMIINRKIWKHI